MALTPSTFILNIGDTAPTFSLPDPSGKLVSLKDFEGCKATVIMFWSNHCPFVKLLKKHISDFAREVMKQNVAFIAINSNDVNKYPDDSPEKMAQDIENFAYPFAYLFDEDQSVAHSYKAACTPDFFIFDSNFKLQYMGQYDSARPGNEIAVSGNDLSRAIQSIIENGKIDFNPTPAAGCNIKWKPGNEPTYFG
ncbi:MAG: thioredoxin family protein [bacterium]|nr:thioredoxin family protein [bacterium]